jgi:hypothetical protein
MASAADYRRHAAECLRLADRTKEPEAKAMLHSMADAWLQLARELADREARKDMRE